MKIKTLLDLHYAAEDLELMASFGRLQTIRAKQQPDRCLCRLSNEAITKYEELAQHIRDFNSRFQDTIEGAINAVREMPFDPITTPIEELVGLS